MKKAAAVVTLVVALTLCLGGCGSSFDDHASASNSSLSSSSSAVSSQATSASSSASSVASSTTSTTVFGTPKVVDVKSGDGSTSVGQCGVFHASTEDCTSENLAAWYADYVQKSGHNWDVIVYTNKSGYGVYAGAGMIEVGVKLEADSDGSYSVADSSGATTYIYDSATKSLTAL